MLGGTRARSRKASYMLARKDNLACLGQRWRPTKQELPSPNKNPKPAPISLCGLTLPATLGSPGLYSLFYP